MSKSVLAIIDDKEYYDGIIEIIKKENESKILYITMASGYKDLVKIFDRAGISTEKIFFIDCVSGPGDKEPANCIFLGSTQGGSLLNIGIAINRSVQHLGSELVLMMDSVAILSMYNDSDTLQKFYGFLLEKMRYYRIKEIVLAVKSGDDVKAIARIRGIVDEVKECMKN